MPSHEGRENGRRGPGGCTGLHRTVCGWKTASEINAELGFDAIIGVKHNIADESGWAEVVAKVVETFGTVDILINNAALPGKTREDVAAPWRTPRSRARCARSPRRSRWTSPRPGCA
ncbi:SDR family NAD(P)-dependent oxidoreductase [Nocardia gipuzkoensis]